MLCYLNFSYFLISFFNKRNNEVRLFLFCLSFITLCHIFLYLLFLNRTWYFVVFVFNYNLIMIYSAFGIVVGFFLWGMRFSFMLLLWKFVSVWALMRFCLIIEVKSAPNKPQNTTTSFNISFTIFAQLYSNELEFYFSRFSKFN
jgi:hypothetical protein